MSRDRAHMSAIGREGGHSRGRARTQQGGDGHGMDTERSSFIGQANDRGTFGEAERGTTGAPRNEQRGNESSSSNTSRENDSSNSQGRGSL